MPRPRSVHPRTVLTLLFTVSFAIPAAAQYAETPQELVASDGPIDSAVQIGRRLFVGGSFCRLSPPTGNAVIVNASGAHVPGAFPRVTGLVSQIVSDGPVYHVALAFGRIYRAGEFRTLNGAARHGLAALEREALVNAIAATSVRVYVGGPGCRRSAFTATRVPEHSRARASWTSRSGPTVSSTLRSTALRRSSSAASARPGWWCSRR